MEDYYSESGDNSNIKNFLGNMSVFTRWYAYETRTMTYLVIMKYRIITRLENKRKDILER